MTKPTYHHGNLHAALLAEGLRHVRQHGHSSLGIRECARNVGVDPSATYRHFRNKKDFLAAIAAEGFRELTTQIRIEFDTFKSEEGSDSQVALVRVGRGYITFGLKEPNLYRLMFGDAFGRNDLRKYLEEGIHDAWRILQAAVREGVPDSIPEVRLQRAESAAWSMVHGFVSLALDVQPRSSEEVQQGEIDAVLHAAQTGILAYLTK